ncbi:MAG: T9SS type A sorting domain-containing protein [Flavobacteriaceae bacterium]
MEKVLLIATLFTSFAVFSQSVVINEVDSNTPGTDTAEFVELYSSTPNFNLDGYVLVLFNGGDDASYASYDLDGHSTNNSGYFVIGDTGVTGVSINFPTSPDSFLQNGADAVTLYQASKSDFPNDTSVTTTNLIDAIVYDNNRADDTGLLTGLGETVQYNEDAANDAENHSLQRQSDGSFAAGIASPNTSNLVLDVSESLQNLVKIHPNPTSKMLFLEGLKEKAVINIFSLTGQQVLRQYAQHRLDVSALVPGVYMVEVIHGKNITRHKLWKR